MMTRNITTEEFVHMLNAREEFIPLDIVTREGREDIVLREAIKCPAEDIDRWAEENLDKKDEKIIIYCGGNLCGSISDVAKSLDKKGFSCVFKYEGSMEDLSNAGLGVYKPGVLH